MELLGICDLFYILVFYLENCICVLLCENWNRLKYDNFNKVCVKIVAYLFT